MITTGIEELCAAAEAEIETLSAEEALALHGDDGVTFGRSPRHPRVVARGRDSRGPACAARHARILGRSRKPLPPGGVRQRQEVRVLLRRRPALGPGHADGAEHGPRAGRPHRRRLRRLEGRPAARPRRASPARRSRPDAAHSHGGRRRPPDDPGDRSRAPAQPRIPRMNDLAAALPYRRAIADLPASKIREIATLGMVSAKADTIPLWFGEPDLPTPDFINRAATRALAEGHTFYTLNRGIPELREAIAGYMSRLHGRAFASDRITVTASAMNAIALLMQTLIDRGDNAVLVAPLWPNIAAAVGIMGGDARQVALAETGTGWRLDLERLFDAVDERTRLVFVNSPSNPTGWMMTADDQRALLDFCRGRGLWLVADEVYDRIVYDRAHAPSFLDIGEPGDLVLCINSFSKSWCMTGWRLGWITAPAAFGPVLEKMNGVQRRQRGPAWPSTPPSSPCARARRSFARPSRATAARAISCSSAWPPCRGVRLVRPEAAFYAFFAVDGMDDSLAFAKRPARRDRGRAGPGRRLRPGRRGPPQAVLRGDGPDPVRGHGPPPAGPVVKRGRPGRGPPGVPAPGFARLVLG